VPQYSEYHNIPSATVLSSVPQLVSRAVMERTGWWQQNEPKNSKSLTDCQYNLRTLPTYRKTDKGEELDILGGGQGGQTPILCPGKLQYFTLANCGISPWQTAVLHPGKLQYFTLANCSISPWQTAVLHPGKLQYYTLTNCSISPWQTAVLHPGKVQYYNLANCSITPWQTAVFHPGKLQ